MTEKFLNSLKSISNYTLSENGAVAKATTNSEMLNFFSQGGAIRNRTPEEQQTLFLRAWNESPELALRAMFYFRDIRGGQGQRGAFRNQLKLLAQIAPSVVRKNLYLIAEFGRWDDVYALDGTEVESDVYELISNQLDSDIADAKANKSISLLAKWLKSENASSKETKRLASKTRKALGFTPKQYRTILSDLRGYLDVTERKTSSNAWNQINYSGVPSNAMMKYRNAFRKHDQERFSDFITRVNSGEEKINSSALYPYEIVEKILQQCCFAYYSDNYAITPQLAQAMWDNLPNYIGEEENSIAVVDTSGSMTGIPMNVAISLGIYLAERAKGPYKDHFITFSRKPQLQKISGNGIYEKVKALHSAHWEQNTDIEAVFDLILSTAIKNKLTQDEIVDKLYIISDMEFDKASRPYGASTLSETLFETISNNFAKHGYKMPKLVFWNVDARNSQFPMSMDERGFQNVSGFSPSIFASLMSGEFVGPYEIMEQVLNSERYSVISV